MKLTMYVKHSKEATMIISFKSLSRLTGIRQSSLFLKAQTKNFKIYKLPASVFVEITPALLQYLDDALKHNGKTFADLREEAMKELEALRELVQKIDSNNETAV